MTEYISRDNLKSMLASKMAVFNNAMLKIQRAETQSIFATMSQKTAEYRMSQFMAMVEEWEGVKSYSELISEFIAETQINAMLCQVNNFQAKVSQLQALSDEYKAQAKDEAFQLLDVGIDMMEENLKTLDEQIANCKDPDKLSALNEEKTLATERLKEANRIKTIEDPDEAMKELYGFSQDCYKDFLKKTTSMSDDEIEAKLATVKPEGDNVFGYFKATQGVWGLFKEGIHDLNQNLDAKKEQLGTLNTQYSDLEKEKQDLITQQEAINNKETGIKQKETYLKITKLVTAPSAVLSPLASSGISITQKHILGNIIDKDKEKLNQSQEEFKQNQAKVSETEASLNTQFEELINPESGVNSTEVITDNTDPVTLQGKIESIEDKQQSIKASTESIEAQQEQLSNVSERIDKINNSENFQELNKKMDEVSEKVEEIREVHNQVKIQIDKIRKHERSNTEKQILEQKSAIKEGYSSTLKTIQDSKLNASNSITSESLTVNELTAQINNVKNQLKESQQLSEYKKKEVQKEARQMREQAEQSKNNGLISKITNFIKSNSTDDAKVVIDQSLSDLYSDLSINFGSDRVVIDKRGGDRRSGEDRRLKAQNNSPQDNDNFFSRKNDSTRRNNDRRQSNHIFISQDTLKNWDFE